MKTFLLLTYTSVTHIYPHFSCLLVHWARELSRENEQLYNYEK